METDFTGDGNFRSTNEVEELIVISFQTQVLISCCTVADARVFEHVSVSVSVSKLETLLHGNVDFLSTDQVDDHCRWFCCGWSCIRVCVGAGVGVEIRDISPSVEFELETLLRRSLFRLG